MYALQDAIGRFALKGKVVRYSRPEERRMSDPVLTGRLAERLIEAMCLKDEGEAELRKKARWYERTVLASRAPGDRGWDETWHQVSIKLTKLADAITARKSDR
jgi:hypothetical protein